MTTYSERDEQDHQYQEDIRELNKEANAFYDTLFCFVMGIISLVFGLIVVDSLGLSEQEQVLSLSVTLLLLGVFALIHITNQIDQK